MANLTKNPEDLWKTVAAIAGIVSGLAAVFALMQSRKKSSAKK